MPRQHFPNKKASEERRKTLKSYQEANSSANAIVEAAKREQEAYIQAE